MANFDGREISCSRNPPRPIESESNTQYAKTNNTAWRLGKKEKIVLMSKTLHNKHFCMFWSLNFLILMRGQGHSRSSQVRVVWFLPKQSPFYKHCQSLLIYISFFVLLMYQTMTQVFARTICILQL